jgi:hypothetical protein
VLKKCHLFGRGGHRFINYFSSFPRGIRIIHFLSIVTLRDRRLPGQARERRGIKGKACFLHYIEKVILIILPRPRGSFVLP